MITLLIDATIKIVRVFNTDIIVKTCLEYIITHVEHSAEARVLRREIHLIETRIIHQTEQSNGK